MLDKFAQPSLKQATCITDCDRDLALNLVLARGLILARAWRHYFAVFLRYPVRWASAAHAGLVLIVVLADDLELLVPVVTRAEASAERLRCLYAVTVNVARLDHPAGVA